MRTERGLDPAVPDETAAELYLYAGDGPPRLVTALPDGSPMPSLPSSPAFAASADGSRIAFDTDSYAANKIYVRFDASDPAHAQTREVAMGPAGETCDNARIGPMSADGTRLMFSCLSNPLTDDADPAVGGLYIRNLDSGAVDYVGAAGNGAVLAATGDLSRVYFRSVSALVGGEQPGGIYLLRDGHVQLVAAAQNSASCR